MRIWLSMQKNWNGSVTFTRSKFKKNPFQKFQFKPSIWFSARKKRRLKWVCDFTRSKKYWNSQQLAEQIINLEIYQKEKLIRDLKNKSTSCLPLLRGRSRTLVYCFIFPAPIICSIDLQFWLPVRAIL